MKFEDGDVDIDVGGVFVFLLIGIDCELLEFDGELDPFEMGVELLGGELELADFSAVF